jgi:hypothetical protein
MHTLYRQIYRGERGDTMIFWSGTEEGKCKDRWEGRGKRKD